jgi:hypothetical protein
MTFASRTCLAALALAAFTLPAAAPPGVTLIGKGFIPGTALDKSGLQGVICQAGNPANCVPKAIFGGLGSDLTYTGHNNVFLAAPDRGPFDGLTDVPYLDRFHFLHITVDPAKPFPNISLVLLDTRLLRNEWFQNFVGAAGAFDTTHPRATRRLDPEGVRTTFYGTFFISDEYGPYIFEFGPLGHLLRRIPVPQKFQISNPSADPIIEVTANSSGRQANRGMEGLAITPHGLSLVGIMQNALIQDNGLTPDPNDNPDSRFGLNNRILKINLLTGKTKEYVYVLDAINRGQGVSEILAINDHEFLVLERDNRSQLKPGDPQDPTCKTIYKIDLDGATDVSGTAVLPATGGELAGLGITPVSKTPFLDLLDADFGVKSTIAEKIEGLAWGPDLADGRHVLYVISDNDLDQTLDTQIYAFAIDSAAANLNFQRQFLPFPIFPPWQVKKILEESQP